jgi:metal-dependent amidase/aminoacylase/carboxypeptidase family protein
MNDPMLKTIAAMADEMRSLRRDIHRHPELGYREERN